MVPWAWCLQSRFPEVPCQAILRCGEPSRVFREIVVVVFCTIFQHQKVKTKRDSQNVRASRSAGAE